jgi:hypothetical protein
VLIENNFIFTIVKKKLIALFLDKVLFERPSIASLRQTGRRTHWKDIDVSLKIKGKKLRIRFNDKYI